MASSEEGLDDGVDMMHLTEDRRSSC
jgi:hypothetical protein